ncbi:hypothetical protein ACLB2K_012097 [Fragaria x ananassa]
MDCFEETECTVSITVVGESGDLAKKKIFPALFVLYYYGCLPKHFTIFGYARSKMTDAELRTMDQFAQLDKKLKEHEGGRIPDRLFYLFIPPNIFIDVVCCASLSASSDSELSAADSTSPITEQISSPQDSLNIASDSNQNLHLTLDASWR